jgi:hypothetical protein
VRKSIILSAVAALMLVAAPAALSAQQQGGQQIPPQVQQWIEEAQQIQGQLNSAVERAMESETLRREQAEVMTAVNAAMLAAHPTIEQDMRRINEIQSEGAQAYQRGDQAAVERLTREFEQLDGRIVQARQRALATNGLGERVAAFQERLVARMTQLEPRTPQLIERQEVLQRNLDTAMQQASGR